MLQQQPVIQQLHSKLRQLDSQVKNLSAANGGPIPSPTVQAICRTIQNALNPKNPDSRNQVVLGRLVREAESFIREHSFFSEQLAPDKGQSEHAKRLTVDEMIPNSTKPIENRDGEVKRGLTVSEMIANFQKPVGDRDEEVMRGFYSRQEDKERDLLRTINPELHEMRYESGTEYWGSLIQLAKGRPYVHYAGDLLGRVLGLFDSPDDALKFMNENPGCEQLNVMAQRPGQLLAPPELLTCVYRPTFDWDDETLALFKTKLAETGQGKPKDPPLSAV